uniref:Uncharacterized protein n=1 Tax=Oryzias melastigma TaxID=30732 RepID=A0A3B3CRA2_ORYME
IFSTLKNYNSAVKKISGFQSCMKAAGKVAPVLEKLSKDMIGEEKETQTIEHWKEPLLCRYTLDRLFSFSIHSARVFAAGDPSRHATSSAHKCM